MTNADESAPRRTPPPADEPLDRGVAAVRAWFKAVDYHPETHPAAGCARRANHAETKDLADKTVALLEAVAVLDATPCPEREVDLRDLVIKFAGLAGRWIRAWGWDWAFEAGRGTYVQGQQDLFLEEVGRPLKATSRALWNMKLDRETRARIKHFAIEAIDEDRPPAELESMEAGLRRFDELLARYHEGPIYGTGRPALVPERDGDLLLRLAILADELPRTLSPALQAEMRAIEEEIVRDMADAAKEKDERDAADAAQVRDDQAEAIPQPGTAATTPPAGGRDAGEAGAGDAATAGGGAADGTGDEAGEREPTESASTTPIPEPLKLAIESGVAILCSQNDVAKADGLEAGAYAGYMKKEQDQRRLWFFQDTTIKGKKQFYVLFRNPDEHREMGQKIRSVK